MLFKSIKLLGKWKILLFNEWPFFLGFFACLAAVFIWKPNIVLNDLALGSMTTSVFAKEQGNKIHCTDFSDYRDCKSSFYKSRKRNNILWFGNSQLHAVNQYKLGDETAPKILNRMFSSTETYVLAFSQPNANFSEHEALLDHVLVDFPTKVLILPLVFDDTRETGVRSTLIKSNEPLDFSENKNNQNLDVSSFEKREPHNIGSNFSKKDAFDGEVRLERKVNKWINSVVNRDKLKAEIFIALYNLRNFIFRITPSSKRRLIRTRYNENMAALSRLLINAKKAQIIVIGYIAPIRNDVALPYFADEYETFKRDTRKMFDDKAFQLYDLESLVPGKFWGVKNSTSLSGEPELDFMHFRGEGHKLLADRIYEILGSTREF
jgi:hypothetical protein